MKRGLTKAEAAEYIGVDTVRFDDLLKFGAMPEPVLIEGSPVWDRGSLDTSFEALSKKGAKSTSNANRLDLFKAVLDFIKGCFWPAIALLAILVFYSPIHTVMNALANRANDIQTFKLGYLELQIREDSLPKASKSVADALKKFDPDMVQRIVWLPLDKVTFGSCYFAGITGSENERKALLRLEEAKQIVLDRSAKNTGTDCPEYWDATLTQDGIDTRAFLFGLLQAQIGAAKSS